MASAVISKPFPFMEIVDGVRDGDPFEGCVGVNAEGFGWSKAIQIAFSTLNIYYLSSEPLFHPYRWYGLRGLLFLNVAVMAQQFFKDKSTEKKANYTLNIFGNGLAAASLALVILNGRDKPVRAVVASFSAVMTLLNVYQKLPVPLSKAWSFTPVVVDGIIIYATDNPVTRALACVRVMELAQKYFSPEDQGNNR